MTLLFLCPIFRFLIAISYLFVREKSHFVFFNPTNIFRAKKNPYLSIRILICTHYIS